MACPCGVWGVCFPPLTAVLGWPGCVGLPAGVACWRCLLVVYPFGVDAATCSSRRRRARSYSSRRWATSTSSFGAKKPPRSARARRTRHHATPWAGGLARPGSQAAATPPPPHVCGVLRSRSPPPPPPITTPALTALPRHTLRARLRIFAHRRGCWHAGVSELYPTVHGRLLRRHNLPPHHQELDHPGWRPHRDGPGPVSPPPHTHHPHSHSRTADPCSLPFPFPTNAYSRSEEPCALPQRAGAAASCEPPGIATRPAD